MKIFFLCFIFLFSFPALALLSSKDQYHGFLKYQKQQKTFEKKRKQSFSKYQKSVQSYERQQNKILKKHLRSRRKPIQLNKAQLEWEKEQARENLKREKIRSAYLKEKDLLKGQDRKYQRPQSVPYKSPPMTTRKYK